MSLDRLKQILTTDVRSLLPGAEKNAKPLSPPEEARIRAACRAIGEQVQRTRREAAFSVGSDGGRSESLWRAQIGAGKEAEEAELAKYGLKPIPPPSTPQIHRHGGRTIIDL